MTLATSGEMSIGGTTANRSINLELGLSATANSSLNQTNFRTLAGVTGSGTTISMSNFYGKSNISLASVTGVYGDIFNSGTAFAILSFNSDGSISYSENNSSGPMGNWGGSGIGANYWIRFTQTSSYGASTETGSARNSWLQLSSVRSYGVQRSIGGAGGRFYTIQIASDSGGANIVATTTNIGLEVEVAV